MIDLKAGFVSFVIITIALLTMVIPVFAEEEKPSTDVSVSVMSSYVSKGLQLTRNSIVIQPSMTVGLSGFSVNMWGNLDTHPYYPGDVKQNTSSNWTETDLVLSYSRVFGPVNTSIAYYYYGLAGPRSRDSNDSRDQQEFAFSAGLNTVLSPTLTVWWMFDVFPRFYYSFSLSHSVELTKAASLKLTATAAYMQSLMDPNDSDSATLDKIANDGTDTHEKYNNFMDGNISLCLPYKVTDKITIIPTISYSFPLCKDASNFIKFNSVKGWTNFDSADDQFIYGGVNFDYAF